MCMKKFDAEKISYFDGYQKNKIYIYIILGIISIN